MRINERKAGAILTYVQIIFNNTVSFFYTPIMLDMLGRNQYGLFGTASSLTNYLSLLTLGIGGAYITWNAKYRANNDVEGERRLNGMFFTLFSIIAGITLLAGLVILFSTDFIFGKSFEDNELTSLKWIIFVNICSMMMGYFFTPFTTNIIAYEKFFFSKIVAVANIFVTPVLNLVVLYAGGKAVSLSVATFGLSVVNYVVYAIYARKKLNMRFIFKGFDKQVFKDIMFFSSFLFLNSITDLINNSTDSIILGATLGTGIVAVYTIGKNFQGYFQSFSVSVATVFAPQINLLVGKGEDNSVLDAIMLKIGRIQFYIASLILIGFAFLGKPFVLMWAGEDYKDAYIIGLMLIVATVVPLIQNVGLEIQKAKNKHKFRSVAYFLVALVNIILTIPFTLWWGAIGATFATFLCCIFGQAVAMNIYYAKGIGLNMLSFWKGILSTIPGFIPSIIFGVIVSVFVEIKSWYALLAFALIMCVVYIVPVYFFSMNDYEKDLIKGPIKKLLRIK